MGRDSSRPRGLKSAPHFFTASQDDGEFFTASEPPIRLASLAQGGRIRHPLRIEGRHHIFSHPAIPELVNLQNVGGEAKPYQLRQFLKLLERYDLRLGGGE